MTTFSFLGFGFTVLLFVHSFSCMSILLYELSLRKFSYELCFPQVLVVIN